MQDLIEIGRVAKAHGIRGELCLDYNAESLRLLKDFVYLQAATAQTTKLQAGQVRQNEHARASQPTKYKVISLRQHHGRPLLTLDGVNDRTAAELLRNFSVLVPQNRLPELAPEEIFLRDLPGLRVFTCNLNNQKTLLGYIESVAEVAGQEIWTITATGGQEILFPANEQFVLEIDLERGETLIAPPPGLLELYLES